MDLACTSIQSWNLLKRPDAQGFVIAMQSFGDSEPSVEVIIPCFNSPPGLRGRIEEIVTTLKSLYHPHFILINDNGVPAASVDTLSDLVGARAEFSVLTPPRTIGQTVATLLGLAVSTAPLAVTIDDDGQFQAKDVSLLLDALSENECVVGVAKSSPESWLRLVVSRAYHALTMSGAGYPRGSRPTSLRVLTRSGATRLLAEYRQGQTINAVLAQFVAPLRFVEVERLDRSGGSSTYSRGDLIGMTVRGLMATTHLHSARRIDLVSLIAQSRWGI